MYRFNNDYSQCGYPAILEAIMNMQKEANSGYGTDERCREAKKVLRRMIDHESADIHFLAGGTMTNLCVISHVLRPFEAVIAPETGHIVVHETGAIEATGHKILAVHTDDGKLTPGLIAPVLEAHSDEHMVLPRMVYISQSTEMGTVYTKEELEKLYQYCQENGLYLYMDGARLAAGLAVKETGLTLSDLPNLTDLFYIGGTKTGALFGEALIITREDLRKNFRFTMKQRGGLFAKGFLVGAQFEALFQDGLFYELGEHENKMAQMLRQGFEEQGYAMLVDSLTNQIFPILPNEVARAVQERYVVLKQASVDSTHAALRFVTSWATTKGQVESFLEELKRIGK